VTTTPTAAVAALPKVRLVNLSSIKPYPRNPRKVPAKAIEQTAKSIREFGWQQPIVVDAQMVIVAGHTRYAAALLLGLDVAPVIIANHLTPAQVKAYRIQDNRSHDYTSWDYPELIAELQGLGDDFADVLDLTDWSALMTAFDDGAGAEERHVLPPEQGSPIPGSTGYSVTVEFGTKDDAERAGPELMKVAGVINVRHPQR
jgi:hypothetical protein